MRQLLFGIFLSVACWQPLAESDPVRPNFLIVMADDCTWNDLPVYGGLNAKTPQLDRLARQGMVFDQAFLAEAMCQPCRAELFTGQYPLRNGCAWNHSASRPQTRSVPHYLAPLGYRVGLAGKVHVKPRQAFPFETVAGFDPNCVRNPTREHDLSAIQAFMERNDRQPFFLTVALVEPHVPWVMGDASQYPPAELKLPPNIADTPTSRDAFSRYLAEITYMDAQVGDILDTLERAGKAENTLVIFTSEQGSQFPGCKWTNWNTGVHTALIARWPGRIPPATRTQALVQYADVLPTLLHTAGAVPEEPSFDGSSFLPVLLGERTKHRTFAFAIHNNLPEGPAYPVRAVTDGRFRYIRNLLPDEIYLEKHLMGWSGRGQLNNPYWQTWVRDAWQNPQTYRLVKRYLKRPQEELYHSLKDPYEFRNLADSPDHAATKLKLAKALDQWMSAQGDPGIPQDTPDALKAARDGNHLFFPPD